MRLRGAVRLRGSVGAVVATIAVATVAVLGFAAPAQAHNYLVSSTPEADSTLTELPEAFEIVTNDNLLVVGDGAGGFALQVRDAAGLYYGDGCVEVEGATMRATPALGDAGDYTVLWQVVSADGHTVSDEYTFSWAPTDPTQATEGATTGGAATAPVCGGTQSAGTDDADAATPPAASDEAVTDVLWIVGTLVVLAVAVVVTLLVIGRRRRV